MKKEKRSDEESTFHISLTEKVPAALRGTGRDGVEDGFRAAHRVPERKGTRLRQVPPVIADRVTDPKRSVSREADEKKWYHGHIGSSSGACYEGMHEEAGFFVRALCGQVPRKF